MFQFSGTMCQADMQNFRERVDQQAINPCWSVPRFAPLNGLVTPSNFYKLAATKGARFRCSCLGVWGNKQSTHPLFRQQKDAGTFCMMGRAHKWVHEGRTSELKGEKDKRDEYISILLLREWVGKMDC
jgi:hypothetical protein